MPNISTDRHFPASELNRDEEMYTLSSIPSDSNIVKGMHLIFFASSADFNCFLDRLSSHNLSFSGDLNGRGEGVVSVMSGRKKISMHKGSLLALQAHHDGQ